MKRSVCVIGAGFVGGSLTTVLSERNIDVYNYDITGKVAPGGIRPRIPPTTVIWKEPEYAKSISDVIECTKDLKGFTNIYFVCLPTPMFDTGECDTSIVEGVLKELANVPGDRIVVVKSTVPPGSTEKWNKMFEGTGLHVVFNPEFLVENRALDDMRNQTRIILGGPRPWISKVKQLYQSAFPQVPIIKTSSTNAELVKYVTNTYLAMKISYANEMYQLCNALDAKGLNVDYDRVIECATLDPRLGTSHWKVPSFETDENGNALCGFSLSCFPKDLNALIHKSHEVGVEPTMLEATWKKNLEVRPQKDWEKMLGRAVSKKDKP